MILEKFVTEYPTSYPPTVVNITDGVSTDGDPTPAAQAIQQLSTSDGSVLVYNIHISSTPGREVVFSNSAEALPDQDARAFFNMSSPLPEHQLRFAQNMGYPLTEGARGFGFNVSQVTLAELLLIGTQTTELR